MEAYKATTLGPFAMQVTAVDWAGPPHNDTCSGATPSLVDPETRQALVEGIDLSNARHDYLGTCSEATNGRDVVFQLDLGESAMVTATVTPAADSPSLRPAVYIRRDCIQGAEAEVGRCAAAAAGASATTGPVALPRGSYQVVVDSTQGTSGTANLAVTLATIPPGDSCHNAVPLVFVDGTAQVVGDNTNATPGSAGSCRSINAGDLVYVMELPEPRSVTPTVGPDPDNPRVNRPVLYVRTSCEDPASEIGCQWSTTTATLFFPVLEARTPYFVFVNSAAVTMTGGFRLTAVLGEVAAAPENDRCVTLILK